MKLLLLIAGWLLVQALPAQTPAAFMVLKTEGKAAYKRAGYTLPLQIGTSLSESDELFLYGKASVTVVCNNYSSFTLTAAVAGKNTPYSLRRYTDSCGKQKSNYSAAFLKYVWTHLREKKVTIDDTDKKHLRETGAVTRGCPDAAFDGIRENISVYLLPFRIRYPRKDTSSSATLLLFENEDDMSPVYSQPIQGNSILIGKKLMAQLQDGKTYYYTVSTNGTENCGRKRLYKMSGREYNALMSAQNEASFKALAPADKAAIVVTLLQKNSLVAEQYAYIKKSIQNGGGIAEAKDNLEAEFLF